MSDPINEIKPVTEESNYKGVYHVNVDKTVEAVKKQLENSKTVTLVARQSEISRIGMIIKRVEEEAKCRIDSMKTNYQQVKDNEREFNAIVFKVVFTKA